MTRPRHVNKELEALLKEAATKGWAIKHNPKTGYYRLRCACGVHSEWVKKTPSNPQYEQRLREQLKRTGCWKEAEEDEVRP